MELNTQLDTQEAIFNISDKVTKLSKYWLHFPACNTVINPILDDHACIDRLHYAKDVSVSKSKACIPKTRVALLEQIQVWALSPTGKRALLLHGAAGKGKSAIVHTVAIVLESLGVAVVPFFAFNCSVNVRGHSYGRHQPAPALAPVDPAPGRTHPAPALYVPPHRRS